MHWLRESLTAVIAFAPGWWTGWMESLVQMPDAETVQFHGCCLLPAGVTRLPTRGRNRKRQPVLPASL